MTININDQRQINNMYFQQKRPLLYVLYPLAINITPLNSYIDEIAVPRIWQTYRYDGPAVSLYLKKSKIGVYDI